MEFEDKPSFARCAGVDLQHGNFVGRRITPHIHEDYQIAVIVGGALSLRVQGVDTCLTPLSIAAINPGEVHSGHGGPQGWRCRNFYVPRQFVDDLQIGEGVREFQAPRLEDIELGKSLAEAHRACLLDGERGLACETILTAALGSLFSRHARVNPSRIFADSRVSSKHVADYIQAHFARKLGLAELAHVAGLSPFHFIRTFARDVGLTPHAYQIQVRLQFARERLAQGALAADVAVEVGFADQSHLIRELQRTLGVTPSLIQRLAR